MLLAVYSPNNRNKALSELCFAVSEQQTAHPHRHFIFTGDFNHADLITVFPKFHQHVGFPTRGNNILGFISQTTKGHTGMHRSPIQACMTTPHLS